MTAICWMCGEEFEEDPEQLKAWANSGENFEPTDWECDECQKAWKASLDADPVASSLFGAAPGLTDTEEFEL